jgi:hypothetical protein
LMGSLEHHPPHALPYLESTTTLQQASLLSHSTKAIYLREQD